MHAVRIGFRNRCHGTGWLQLIRMSSSVGLDPYGILGIDSRASQSEIKAAYRLLALKTHPDRQGGSAEDFKRAALAYEMLSNPSFAPIPTWHYRPPANWATLAGLRADRYAMRTVSDTEAERLFRQAFGGRSVKQVLEEADRHADGSLVDHGIFAACTREAMFNKFLLEARAKADLQKHVGHGESSTITTREKFTTKDGRGFVKVKQTTCWWDGRVATDIVMKERHRL